MTMRNTLLSGIAGLAIAGVLSFGAFGQTVAPSAPPQATNPGQTPATAPSVKRSAQHYHHHTFRGQSGPQDSTPAEHAATDRLNQQQLQTAASPAPTMTPTGQPTTDSQQTIPAQAGGAPPPPTGSTQPGTPPQTP